MKTYLFNTLFTMLALFNTVNLQAQHMDESKNNYEVMTKKVPQLQPIIMAAEALKAEDGKDFGDFQVIICGKEIGDVTDTEKITGFIEKAEKAGVSIIACGFSLTKFKVDRTKVPKKLQVVENGILHNLQLQKKGYKSISL